MKTIGEYILVAPCGIYCGDCGAYKVKDDPSLGESINRVVNWNGVPCPGCRPVGGNCQFTNGLCETYACVTEHNVEFCFECPEFPCPKLNPSADMANIIPHNIKMYNLCYIRQQGLTRFLEKTPDIKQRYFRGKMAIGKGPQLD